MKRLTQQRLLNIGETLAVKERELLRGVARLGLVTHLQAGVLLGRDVHSDATSASRARVVRARLQHLTDLGLLARLQRRIGGLRAGSAGYVYYLGPAGQRLVAYWQGRGLVRGRYRPEPGSRHVRHRLAVAQLYVEALQAAERGELDLLAFDAEPDCWREHADAFAGRHLLKPDAFVRIGLGAYEDRFFIEVDLGTESRSVIARKLRAYLAYYLSGIEQTEHGVFPRVLLLTHSEERKRVLAGLCSLLPAEHWVLFTVQTLDNFTRLVTGKITEDAHDEQPAGGLE